MRTCVLGESQVEGYVTRRFNAVRRLSTVVSAGALVVSGLVTLPALTSSASASPSPTTGAYVALSPSRVLDTRGTSGPVAADHAIAVTIGGRGGVATGAAAVVLNITVTSPASTGFITAYPDGTQRPTASNLNFVKGQTISNAAIVRLPANGKIDLYNSSGGSVQLIADASGYYSAGAGSDPGTFTGLNPTRLLDTRGGVGAPRAAVAANHGVSLQVSGKAAIPAGAGSVVLNVTATGSTVSGFLTVYPDGSARPTASNVNFGKGQSVPNLVVVKLSAAGKVDIFNSSGGTVQIIADVAGYYVGGSPILDDGALTTFTPARILDTRGGVGAAKAAVKAHTAVAVKVTGGNVPPAAGVSAVILNVTATSPTAAGYISVYPDHTPRPNASAINFTKGKTVPNLVIARIGTDGKVDLLNSSGGTVQLVADIAGYVIGLPAPDDTVGTIQGTVTDTSNAPLQNVEVDVWTVGGGEVDPDGDGPADFAITAADGSYSMPDVPPSSTGYLVCFDPSSAIGGTATTGWIAECDNSVFFDGTDVPAGATMVKVSGGSQHTINAALAVGGAISGTVTSAAAPHGPLRDEVELSIGGNESFFGAGISAADGTYTIKGLPTASDYVVCFIDFLDPTSGQCYNGITWNGDIDPTLLPGVTKLSVTPGNTVTGIDAQV
jgi:hypothetical protein